MNLNIFFRIWIISYIFYEIAAFAGKNHNRIMLWLAIAAAYIIITRWFPPFQNDEEPQ